jgi:ABC-2 type transport system ATP-binding protein
MIEIDNLSKSYGLNHVLKGVSGSFQKGNVYGIVGENGAGKTTLFRCMAGLESCNGKISSECSPLKNCLGFLPTEPFFFKKITGTEYIRLLCNARGVKAEKLLEKNIFDLPLNRYASTYSTGMKKKLALMAILLQENQYFIMDEPFNGIDIQSNIVLVDIIHTLKELGKTILVSSHIFSTLSDTCDEIYLLENGTFAKKVMKKDFSLLEQEMKTLIVGDKIKRLALK